MGNACSLCANKVTAWVVYHRKGLSHVTKDTLTRFKRLTQLRLQKQEEQKRSIKLQTAL